MDGKNARFTSEIKVELPLFREFLNLSIDVYTRSAVFRLLQIVFVLFYIANMASVPFMIGFFLLAVLFPLAEWWNRRKYKDGGVAYKQLLYQHEGNIPHQVFRFEDDHVVAHNLRTDNERVTPYSQYVRLWESKNLLVLILDVNMYQIIDKRTLTGGTADELVAFLREKCPNLKKKVAKGTLGRFVRRLLWVVIALGILLAILNFLHVPEKLRGQMTNDMPVREMAEELAALDIAISDQALDQILLWESDCTSLFPSYPGNSKAMDLLCCEGMGSYNYDTWEWTPSTSGVYWFDLEVMNVTSIYSDFLAGVDAMDEALSFSNIREDYSQADVETGRGSVTFSFDYLGEHFRLEALYSYDWFDTDIIYKVGRILAADNDPKDLWMISDGGQGILLYYGTEEQMLALSKKTGIVFYDCVTMRMGH